MSATSRRRKPPEGGPPSSVRPSEIPLTADSSRNTLTCELMLESMPDSVVFVDPDGIVRFLNHPGDITGLRRDELVGRHFSKLPIFAKELLPEYIVLFQRLLKGQSIAPMDIQLRKRDGTWCTVEIRAQALNIGGRLEGVCVVARDVTQQRQAEHALRESEEKFKILAEQSPHMVFINRGGRIVYANKRCEEIMGYPIDELCGEGFNFLRLVAPEYHGRTMANLGKHMKGEEVEPFEYEIVTRDGRRIAAYISTKAIKYEGENAVMGIVSDISRLKQSQTRLRMSTVKLREQKRQLAQKNTALKEILAQIQTDKMMFRKQLISDVEQVILPVARGLRESGGEAGMSYASILETNIKALSAGAGVPSPEALAGLSPREVEICGMIRGGATSKSIARLLGIALRTVETHRNAIRKKLGMKDTGESLTRYLLPGYARDLALRGE